MWLWILASMNIGAMLCSIGVIFGIIIAAFLRAGGDDNAD